MLRRGKDWYKRPSPTPTNAKSKPKGTKMSKKTELEKRLIERGERIIQKRLERIERRWIVLFPWLRTKWLLKKLRWLHKA